MLLSHNLHVPVVTNAKKDAIVSCQLAKSARPPVPGAAFKTRTVVRPCPIHLRESYKVADTLSFATILALRIMQTPYSQISYVRNLEAQLAAVRKQLESERGLVSGPPADSIRATAGEAELSTASSSMPTLDPAVSQSERVTASMTSTSSAVRGSGISSPRSNQQPATDISASIRRSNSVAPASAASQSNGPTMTAQSPSFAQELKELTLEATAERHLGSSSGVAFAKLTQMILCRLTPDKADFVFTNDIAVVQAQGATEPADAVRRGYQESTSATISRVQANNDVSYAGSFEPAMMDFNSPSDLFNNSSVMNSLSDSISVYPLLFGDVFLSDIMEPASSLADLPWPPPAMGDDGVGDEEHVALLVDFYFAHSNTLYPIVVRERFMATLSRMQSDPARAAAGALTPLDLFRVWMVLAIGSTAFSSVSLADESEPMLYYNKALQYVEEALAMNEMAALEVLTLQVSYSFFNQLGPSRFRIITLDYSTLVGFI